MTFKKLEHNNNFYPNLASLNTPYPLPCGYTVHGKTKHSLMWVHSTWEQEYCLSRMHLYLTNCMVRQQCK